MVKVKEKHGKREDQFDAAVTSDCCMEKDKKESERVEEDGKRSKNGNEGVRKKQNKPSIKN